VWFTHSLRSCWNHGNAHFLRGVLRALQSRGHATRACEPATGWSATNLRQDQGNAALASWREAYPDLVSDTHAGPADLERLVDDADVVIVHEWNEPSLVAALGAMRRRGASFTLLFHDTHHRAVSDPDAIRAFDLSGYDGILAFGETLAEMYRGWGWGRRVAVWHEAADTTLFRPPEQEMARSGAVWIGNWGDGERGEELAEFLLRPAVHTGVALDIFGVRYPDEALGMLASHGARYRGWLANVRAPAIYARHRLTVHVPRRHYVGMLPGIPTIRVFEALACGIPLVSAPWRDSEGLFRPGADFLMAKDEAEMSRHMRSVCEDRDLASALAASGLATIEARHSCDHRAMELLGHLTSIGARVGVPA
jgi:spore maturation protein CgeB